LEQRNGGKVADADVLKVIGIDEMEYHRNYKKFCPVVKSSIEHCVNTDIEGTGENKKDFNKYLVANNLSSHDSKMIRREFISKLMGKNFTKQERLIIVLYYYEDFTMREIAHKLDMSESRVSQIHQEVMDRIRVRMGVNPKYFATDDILSMISNCNDRDTIL
jgi:RNA polymerase sigma factor for flagellar operon FliA